MKAWLRTTCAGNVKVLALGLALALGACKKDEVAAIAVVEDPTAVAEDGSDVSVLETNSQLLTSTLVATTSSGSLSLASAGDLLPGDLSTADVGDATKALYFPRACLAVAHDAGTRTVTYTFSGCIGPNGLARVRGEVKATYSADAGRLVLDLVATDLQLNGATVDWSAKAEVSAEGVARTMRWRAQLSGTTGRGRELTRTTDKTLTWTVGERCVGVSGSSEGAVGKRNLRTVVTDYRRCQRGCPEAGGKITTTNLDNGKVVEIRFDGTDQATYVTPNGKEKSLPLQCAE
jgi:hypothetical protein